MLSRWAIPALVGLGLNQRRALDFRTHHPGLLAWPTRQQNVSASFFTVDVRFRHQSFRATLVSCHMEWFNVMFLNHQTSSPRRVIGIGHQLFSPRNLWTLVRIMRPWTSFNAHARETLPLMHFQVSRSGDSLSRTARSPCTVFVSTSHAISLLTRQLLDIIPTISIMAGLCTRIAEFPMSRVSQQFSQSAMGSLLTLLIDDSMHVTNDENLLI